MLCDQPEVYDLIEEQFPITYFKLFLTQIMLGHKRAKIHCQELALVCLMQLQTRGQALKT